MEVGLFILNVGAALLMGIAIGLERQFRQHPAGLRTNALVCVGAALFVSLSRLMGDKDSPTRIASYIVSGIGFLGGGVIRCSQTVCTHIKSRVPVRAPIVGVVDTGLEPRPRRLTSPLL